MYCKKCGRKLVKKICIHCGLMDNGVYVDTKKPIKENDLEKYLDKEYDKIMRNQNWIVSGIFGPIYILCRGNILVGLLLTILDIFLLIFFICFNNWALFVYMIYVLDFVVVIINRVIWATFANPIYIYLVSWKINKVKNRYPNNYENILKRLHKVDTFIVPFRYLIAFIIFYIFFTGLLFYVYDLLQLNL